MNGREVLAILLKYIEDWLKLNDYKGITVVWISLGKEYQQNIGNKIHKTVQLTPKN